MEQFITIAAGTEINNGPSEDSDSFGVLNKDIEALVVGEIEAGALPVRLVLDGRPELQTRYFHQPPPKTGD